MVLGQHTNYFLGNRWVWYLGRKNHFARRKAGLEVKTKFFLGRRSFWAGKSISFLGKTKKSIFLECGRIVSQKMMFFVFHGKSWFSVQNHFFLGAVVISLRDHIFLSKECVFRYCCLRT